MKSAPRPCTHPGCGALVDGGSRCPKHARPSWKHARTSAGRGYGYRWQVLRKQILRRDGGLCQVCLAKNVLTVAGEVDHIVPKRDGGTDDPENLRAICATCHAAKSSAEGRGGRSIL